MMKKVALTIVISTLAGFAGVPTAFAQGSDRTYLGEVKFLPSKWCPEGFTEANGQYLPVKENVELFSLLGTLYGGDGRLTFGLPDLRQSAPVSATPNNQKLTPCIALIGRYPTRGSSSNSPRPNANAANLSGTWRIKVAATGRHLHADGNGDKLISTRYQPDDNFTRLILSRQSDGTYRIRVMATGRSLHSDGGGDRLLSTRYQPDDDFTHFRFERFGDGRYRIVVKATGRHLHVDGGGDRLVSTRYQPNDTYTRFILERQ
jgi:hypothetical protein